ncbi:Gfo/Idh/MocA family oxidoreductase [Phytohabitans flavus]|uniref:Oxidoreductase n=1 Tax=Phytohabitans flavus TaxID=1076124 RepID=A0A6F8XLT5_9ACTN|nr:Gfo/Idh/MocA family oxidoreductase [Phytohabitans flavus]BCB74758.1 oxidoreductase [Phytohabitans flavus]
MTQLDAIGVGIVGLSAGGGWAGTAHVPALAGVKGYELRALTASTRESARAAGERYEVPLVFDSAEELASHPDVDLVVVTVRVPHHEALVRPALQAGKMVLCEWPLAVDLPTARRMSALAGGIRTAVGLQARSAPALRYLRDLIADGYVGEVLSTTLIAAHGGFDGTYNSSTRYLLDAANGATLLSIPFGHAIDALTMVLGEITDLSATTALRRPVRYHAETGEPATATAPDQVAVTATLESGAVAVAHVRGARYRAADLHWEINGTEGVVVVTAPQGGLLAKSPTLLGARGSHPELAELPVPPSYELVLAGHADQYAYHVAHAYRQLREDITTGSRTIPDFAHAVRLHELLDQIIRSN